MEYIFEFILEFVLEGSVEVIKSSKVPNYIRYPLIGIVSLCYIAVIGLIFFAGTKLLKEKILLGVLLILSGSLLLILSIIWFRKTYFNKKAKNNSTSHL